MKSRLDVDRDCARMKNIHVAFSSFQSPESMTLSRAKIRMAEVILSSVFAMQNPVRKVMSEYVDNHKLHARLQVLKPEAISWEGPRVYQYIISSGFSEPNKAYWSIHNNQKQVSLCLALNHIPSMSHMIVFADELLKGRTIWSSRSELASCEHNVVSRNAGLSWEHQLHRISYAFVIVRLFLPTDQIPIIPYLNDWCCGAFATFWHAKGSSVFIGLVLMKSTHHIEGVKCFGKNFRSQITLGSHLTGYRYAENCSLIRYFSLTMLKV